MSHPRFKIVFDGTPMPDTQLDTIRDNLVRLFKSDRARIERLFGRGPVALKRNLLETEADRYLKALQRAGARVRKEPDLAATLSLVETEAEQAASRERAETTVMQCPKCAQAQPNAVECRACGIVIEKYLARLAVLAESPTGPADTTPRPSPYAPPRASTVSGDPAGPLKVLSFNGRIGRLRYLAWSLVLVFVFVGTSAGIAALVPSVLGAGLLLITSLAMLVVSVQIGVQRLHDMGWSGWLWLLNLAPVINSVFWLIMLVVPGSVGGNRFGAPPPANSLAVNVLGGLLLVVLVGSLLALLLSGFAALAVFGLLFDQLGKGI